LLRPIADAFPHRDQPDHGGRANENAKRSESRAQLLHEQALDAKVNGLEELCDQSWFGSFVLPGRIRY
jgi:hypothetical protein